MQVSMIEAERSAQNRPENSGAESEKKPGRAVSEEGSQT